MSPALKYTLGRFGLFVVVFALLLPVPLNFLVKAMIALVASAAFSYFLLAKWREQMAEQLGSAAERRAAEKRRLRAALAGDEDAAAAGDRVTQSAAPDRAAQPAGDRVGEAAPDRAAQPAGNRVAQAAGDRVAEAAPDRAAQPAGDRAAQPAGEQAGRSAADGSATRPDAAPGGAEAS